MTPPDSDAEQTGDHRPATRGHPNAYPVDATDDAELHAPPTWAVRLVIIAVVVALVAVVALHLTGVIGPGIH